MRAILAIPLGIAVFAWLPQLIATSTGAAARRGRSGESLATGASAADFASWLTSLIPTNPIAAAANGAMLPLILFTLLLALAIARTSTAARETLLGFFRALGDAMLVLVRWVVWLAPIGVFALMLPLGAHGGAGLAAPSASTLRSIPSPACCSRFFFTRSSPASDGFRCATSPPRHSRRN